MVQQIEKLWTCFNDLKENAPTADTRAVIEALRLHSQLMNFRLANIENLLALAARKNTQHPQG